MVETLITESTVERRRANRIPCKIRVALESGAQCARVVASDISSQGAFVRMEKPWPMGTIVTIIIKAGFDKDLVLRSQVVRVREGEGMAILFLYGNDATVRELHAFLDELT